MIALPKSKVVLRTAAVLLGLSAVCLAQADIFDLSWFTIDGGGGIGATGGTFELSGTIGQPDAGILTGGTFELSGGFWLAASNNPCGGSIRGDANCDGGVDFNDIDCFVSALVSVDSWNACGHGDSCDYVCVNDVDRDASVNFNDIDSFVACLINNGCP